MIELDDNEWTFRRQRYEQLRAQIGGIDEFLAQLETGRDEGRAELDEIRQAFLNGGDVEALRYSMDSWSKRHRSFGFAAMNGQMLLNQLVNDSDPGELEPLLRRIIALPEDDADAGERFQEVSTHIGRLREQGSTAAVGRVPTFISWWWWTQDAETWPAMFSSASQLLSALGFAGPAATQWERYQDFRRHVQHFGTFREVEQVLGQASLDAVGVDPSAIDRCRRISTTAVPPAEDDGTYDLNRVSVGVLRAMAKSLGATLRDLVTEQLDVTVKPATPTEFWNVDEKRLREDIWVNWWPQREGPQPTLHLVVDVEGVKLGLNAPFQQPGGKGFPVRVRELVGPQPPEGLDWLPWGVKTPGPGAGEGAMFSMLGRIIPMEEAADRQMLEAALTDVVGRLRPVFGQIWEHTAPADAAEAPAPNTAEADHRLLALRDEFVASTGYPTDGDVETQKVRREFAALLQPSALPALPVSELRRIYGGHGYGYPGHQIHLHATLRDGGEAAIDRCLTAIQYLLWDDVDDVATRIDRVMDEDDLGLRGMKEGVIMKLLAVAHPDRFLPVFPFRGDSGKAALMRPVDLDPPSMQDSVGTRQVTANDALRALTEPLFPGDPWGQMVFLYWIKEREEQTGAGIDEPVVVDVDRIGQAADDLLLPRDFLDDVHGLLDRHKQVVFYGPPGTGKTYVAQRLAEAIAPEPDQRMLIQFHPSTSYEDFFEGYRPTPGSGGGINYQLMDGPLRAMAGRASADSRGRPYVLIIDEINRANLAKVLGELLFLLEYRGRTINPLYRPDEPFMLPPNLWIIGTMNTADRSIATVDMALRRRFQFVPFVPDDREDNPISGLLGRWLADNGQPPWVADLVDGVNQQLRGELGGDHLLLGPSYFMREGLDRDELALIWRYQIEPLVEDLFFGSPTARTFRFEEVWRRHGPSAELDDA